MLPVRGLLHNVVCPAFRDGECEKQRVGGCLFSHDANLLETVSYTHLRAHET